MGTYKYYFSLSHENSVIVFCIIVALGLLILHSISNRDQVDHVEDLPKEPFSLYGTLPRSWKEKNLVTSSRVIEDEEEVSRYGILLPELFQPTVRKNCSSDREKLLKFESEGREFDFFLRSLEQFIETVKGQKNFW